MSVTTAPAADVTVTRTASRARTRGLAVVGAGAAALGGWTVGALLGADYWITDAQGTARVDIPAAVVSTLVVALLGWALLAVLERVATWGRTAWTYLAVGVLAVSMTPIGLVEATASTRIGLMIAHLAVAAVLIPAFTRR
ncbi:DUF6069 family protein [Actinomycetospora straminea]|uniref:Uncharacterized protein n=1 Tax=Actinomycetospora straminea TaxID=663607 RepID=A0ABP9ELM6_9PSEU|nr:DUF6069 family protein [Actinomycetospora straminea]MDD7935067.1 DUF6069 family protein [Actinomycetospora straminea]